MHSVYRRVLLIRSTPNTWVDQAFDQGALLTQLDLAILLGVCDSVISKYVREIQSQGRLLPPLCLHSVRHFSFVN
ncbi:MAG: DUF1670 domain-containing protein [Rhodothermales bacterium]